MTSTMDYLNSSFTKTGLQLYNQDHVFKVLRKVHLPLGEPLVQIEGTYATEKQANDAIELCKKNEDPESTLKLHYEVRKVATFTRDAELLPKRVFKAFDPDVEHYEDMFDPIQMLKEKDWL
jgi:hypothetical protein